MRLRLLAAAALAAAQIDSDSDSSADRLHAFVEEELRQQEQARESQITNLSLDVLALVLVLGVDALMTMPDNQRALSCSIDNIKLFNISDGAVLRSFFTRHTSLVRCWALLHDGRRIVSGSVDMTARIVEHGLAP